MSGSGAAARKRIILPFRRSSNWPPPLLSNLISPAHEHHPANQDERHGKHDPVKDTCVFMKKNLEILIFLIFKKTAWSQTNSHPSDENFYNSTSILFCVLDRRQIENFHDKNFLPDFLLSGNKKKFADFLSNQHSLWHLSIQHHYRYPAFASRWKMTS